MLERRTVVRDDLDLSLVLLNTLEIEVREVKEIKGIPTRHRRIIFPGQDVSGEDARIQEVAAVHTPELVSRYQAMQATMFDDNTVESREPAVRQSLLSRIRTLFGL